MNKIYRKNTREISTGVDGKYRLWVLMDRRKLCMIDNSTLKHVVDPYFTLPIWVLTEVSKSYNFILKAHNTFAYKEEWTGEL